jgi:uncharacterized protein (TIGR00297 family)
MQEEMRREEWRKAISPERDRRQSRMLVGVVGLLLAGLSADAVRRAATLGIRFPAFVSETFALSAGFAFVVRRLRAATLGGAVCGGLICLLLTFWTGIWTASVVRSALTPLVLLFLLTVLATRAGRQRKAMAGVAEGRRGRNAGQVIANLSMAAICVSPWTAWIFGSDTSWMLTGGAIWMMKTMALAALVEATADTVSSEIGRAFGGRPVMVTTMRRVEAGADGAVTLLGSGAGIAGGAAVALAGGWAMRLHAAAVMIALVAGICGLFFDSLVGATLERRGWIGNDLVNFASTACAAAAAAAGCWMIGR